MKKYSAFTFFIILVVQAAIGQSSSIQSKSENYVSGEECGFVGSLKRLKAQKERHLLAAVSRPTLSGPELTIQTTNFIVHYTLSGTDATTQQWADSVAEYAQHCWTAISSLGWVTPPPDGGNGGDDRYDIYIRNTLVDDYYGVAQPENPAPPFNPPYPDGYTSWVEVYKDSLAQPFPKFARLRALVAHEFHHASQIRYSWAEQIWFYENTSVYMENVIYDDVNTLPYRFTLGANPLDSTHFPISYDEPFPPYRYRYAGALWPTLLHEYYGSSAPRRIWERMGTNPGEHTFEDMDSALVNYFSSNLGVALKEYAVWRYFTGSRADGFHFQEASSYPTSRVLSTHSAYPASGNQGSDNPSGPGGTDFIEFRDGSPGLDISFDGQDGYTWNAAVVSFREPFPSNEKDIILDANARGSTFTDWYGNNKIVLIPVVTQWASSANSLTFNYSVNTDNSWPICTALNNQQHPRSVFDGTDGAIVTWDDNRIVQQEVYAQRIQSSGIPLWHVDGNLLFTYPYPQGCVISFDHALVSDDLGGAFFITGWANFCSANFYWSFYKLTPEGTVGWSRPSSFYNCYSGCSFSARMISDNIGNVIVGLNRALVKYNMGGDPLWGPVLGFYDDHNLVDDKAGGTIIYRGGFLGRIEDSTGHITWTASVDGGQAVAGDGSGGAIATWQDSRSGNFDIYAQRVDGNGQVQWTIHGVPICTASADQVNPKIVSDGAGGAIITWEDNRNGNNDLYAQRIDGSGVVRWTTNGVVITTASGDQNAHQVISDNAGGAILVWQDNRNGNLDIYAQRIDANGNALWMTNGVPVTIVAGNQYEPAITTDGANGVFIAWTDERNGNKDIYAQKLNGDGTLGPPPRVTRRLDVASTNPNAGVSIVVDPVDLNGSADGTTPFNRIYDVNSTINLTGPSTVGVSSFDTWQRNGVFYSSNRTISLTLDAAYTMTAKYNAPTPPPSSWAYTSSTGRNATIAVPSSANLKIGTRSLHTGDALGVFFVRNDSLICAGYTQWIEGNNVSITAWGDNDQTPLKDGFSEGELIRWKIWDAMNQYEYDASPTYQSGGSTYSTNSTYVLSSLVGNIIHRLTLPQGWNMMSSYIQPNNPVLETMLSEIISHMVLMKNGAGQVFWPSLGVNQIGSWNIRHGYQIYMQTADTLPNIGIDIIPQSTTISLGQGWNLAPYLRTNPMRIDSALASIASSLVIAKNNFGQIYWPAFGINTIGSMQLGQAYQMYLNQASTLTYPANTVVPLSATPKQQPVAEVEPARHYHSSVSNTGSSAILLVKSPELSDGDEVGVWTSKGTLCGNGIVENGKAVITIWGDNSMTKDVIDGAVEEELLLLTIWLTSAEQEKPLSIVSLTNALTGERVSNDYRFKDDAVSIADVKVNNEVPSTFILLQNYPNPFNPSTVMKYGLPNPSRVRLEVFNILGEQVSLLIDGQQNGGYYELNFQNTELASGVYFYRLQAFPIEGSNTTAFSDTKKMLIIR
ncbi:MAG: T9SS type A sorting domain-containing protein [Ignavibacteriae bacterium]|nr:T9SS type A sorting domain-containing protein [Ignavibacteriota bacterium]